MEQRATSISVSAHLDDPALLWYVNHTKNMVDEITNPRTYILGRLRDLGGAPLSGQILAEELALSRAAVWKHVEALRGAGYGVVSERGGYRLEGDGDFLYPWEFPGLERHIVRYERTESTMDRALELALSGARDKTVVVAETQSSGRGRRGRSWRSERGGLFCTVVRRPGHSDAGGEPGWPSGFLASALPPSSRAQLGVEAAAAALCLALRDLSNEPFKTSWPNDVMLNDAKAAGILAEFLATTEELRILDLGVGANVANRGGEGTVSLADLGSPSGRRELLTAFLSRLEELWANSSPEAAWNTLSGDAGKPVRSAVDGSSLGRAVAVGPDGRLVVETRGGKIRSFGPAEALLDT